MNVGVKPRSGPVPSGSPWSTGTGDRDRTRWTHLWNSFHGEIHECDEGLLVVYYESIKRELKTRPIYECQTDERLKTIPEESTRLVYTELLDHCPQSQVMISPNDVQWYNIDRPYSLLIMNR